MTDNRIRIFRAPHDSENPYFLMRRDTAQDSRLSFEARGLLAYLLSKPGDWVITRADLMREGNCGRDRVVKLLKELVQHGYAKRKGQRRTDNNHWAGVDYEIHEMPQVENVPVSSEPKAEQSPMTCFPSTEIPCTENPLLQNTELDKVQKERVPRKKRAVSGDPKPPQERKPIERSDVFKVVARESFKIADVDTITDGKTVMRINKIVKWLRENSPNATAQTVSEFYKWYDRDTKGRIDRPRDSGKFGERFSAFRDQYRAQQERKTVNISDFSAWRLEEMKQNVG